MANEKRLIDANLLKRYAYADPETGEGAVYVQDIDNAPTVDAVEVVRCKDCKHFVAPQGVSVCDCFHGLGFAEPDDFCSYGERKSDG